MSHMADVVGYYTPDGDTVCPTHGKSKWNPIVEGDETDQDIYCIECRELIKFKPRLCALCGCDIWEHEEFTDEKDSSVHDSCSADEMNSWKILNDDTVALEKRENAISVLLAMKHLSSEQRGWLETLADGIAERREMRSKLIADLKRSLAQQVFVLSQTSRNELQKLLETVQNDGTIYEVENV